MLFLLYNRKNDKIHANYGKIVNDMYKAFDVKKSDQFVPFEMNKILLADDDILCNMTLKCMIEKNGKYQVNSFYNGLSLCNFYEEEYIDIYAIILDIEMPERNGIETAKWIRNYEYNKQRRQIPIIGMTGHNTKDVKNACINAGMNIVLIKPIKSIEVLKTLDDFS